MRGTDPYIQYTLPFDASMVAQARLSISHGDAIVVQKTDFTAAGNTLTVQLTREDTCALPDDSFVFVQLEVQTTGGNSLVTVPEELYTGRLLNGEALT